MIHLRRALALPVSVGILFASHDLQGKTANPPKSGKPNAAVIPGATKRPEPPQPKHPKPGGHGDIGEAVEFPTEYRTIDGTGNNRRNPKWGAAQTEFLRKTFPAYADGAHEPSGAGRPSARAVSNAVLSQPHSIENGYGMTDYLWQWGQFLDHDLDETPTIDPAEPFDIPVPPGDPYFDPGNTGMQAIPLNRSFYEVVRGVRQQVNFITAFIDASNVYGSDETRAYALRRLDGTGKLRTSQGDLLPYNTSGLPNAEMPPLPSSAYFLAGDVRANEQIGLTCMHTLFVREHNFWAGLIGGAGSSLTDEDIYQMARCIVAAEMQAITYNEFLPVLLGPNALRSYRGYRSSVNPGISNVFATAAYRVGHTMLSSTIKRLDASGNPIPAGNLPLAAAFFAPQEVIDHGIDPVLRGLALQRSQQIDGKVVDAVRNFLFGPPGSGGFDLASLNIQRGRDHGLPGYNRVRMDFGLRPKKSFAQINPDPQVHNALASVYGSVSEVDPWVGLLSEPHVRGAAVGETLKIILKDQFERVRDGDRFFYKCYLPYSLTRIVERQTLARIIRRHTSIGSELQENVFLSPGHKSGVTRL